jgi:hypothetical protein
MACEMRACVICGKPFKRERAHMRKPTHGLYCSRACYYKRNGDKERRTCQACGKEFVLRPCEARDDPGRFCSRDCYWRWMQGKNVGTDNHTYKGRLTGTCKQCGKPFEDYPSRVTDSRARVFCSTVCHGRWMSEHLIGEAHPQWRGGHDDYPPDWTPTLRDRVRMEQGNRCWICGLSEELNGRGLSVHHIDYDKNNLQRENLVALCDSCHVQTNSNRPQWQGLLTRFGSAEVVLDGI